MPCNHLKKSMEYQWSHRIFYQHFQCLFMITLWQMLLLDCHSFYENQNPWIHVHFLWKSIWIFLVAKYFFGNHDKKIGRFSYVAYSLLLSLNQYSIMDEDFYLNRQILMVLNYCRNTCLLSSILEVKSVVNLKK